MHKLLSCAFGALLLGAAPASAQSLTCEDFTAGDGGWVMGPFAVNTVHEAAGGNPGGWVHGTMGSGGNPDLYGPANAPGFSGDFRATKVSGASADLRQDQLGTGQQFPVWLMLVNDPDPMVMFDEIMVAVQADGMPLSPPEAAGWFGYTWTIPSASTTLPAGWSAFGPPGMTADMRWNLVIQNVTSCQVHFANNPFFGFDLIPFQDWDFGMDNFCIARPTGESFCFGDGGVNPTCTPCPCGNNAMAGAGTGCLNSTGAGARLLGSGSPSVSSDTLRFEAAGIPALTSALLTSGMNALPLAGPCAGLGTGIATAGDGLRCVGGDFRRHGTRQSDANGDVGVTTPGWGPPNGPAGGIIASSAFAAGQTRRFQIFYRDDAMAVCSTGFNTTQAFEVVVTN